MLDAPVVAVYGGMVLWLGAVLVVLILILLHLKKSAKQNSQGLDTAFRLVGMGKQARKELREEEREIESEKGIGREIVHELREFTHEFREFTSLLRQFLFPRPRSFQISQINGGNMIGKITGIAVGATGVFKETDIPAGAVDPAGSVRKWLTDDAVNTVLTPSADNSTVAVAVAASAPVGGKFNLSFTDTFPDGTNATSGLVPVPFLPAVVVGNRPTDFLIDQVS